jgi:hypothetical protein
MKYILEIYYRGDCIEHRECKEQFIAPTTGERIYVEFENPHYSEEYGHWWTVRERKHLIFAPTVNLQTLQLFCEPDPKQGE